MQHSSETAPRDASLALSTKQGCTRRLRLAGAGCEGFGWSTRRDNATLKRGKPKGASSGARWQHRNVCNGLFGGAKP
jgi:hypothetical protein